MALTVTAYTTQWCSDCTRSKRILRQEAIPFAEIDIEAVRHAEEAMRKLNGGSGKVPTILLESERGRDILIEPSDKELLATLHRHCPSIQGEEPLSEVTTS